MNKTYSELYYEIRDNENYIRIEIIGLIYPTAELDWDKNWLETNIDVKAGAFTGNFEANFMTIDFERFKNELIILYNNLERAAKFISYENQVEITIKGNGFGHLIAFCKLMDSVGVGNELEIELSFDQTQIPKMIKELDNINRVFPVTGNLI